MRRWVYEYSLLVLCMCRRASNENERLNLQNESDQDGIVEANLAARREYISNMLDMTKVSHSVGQDDSKQIE